MIVMKKDIASGEYKKVDPIMNPGTENFKIEDYITEGMDFYNIHVDHHIPLSSAKNEQELIDLCHYTNCKPMFAIDNIRKGSTILS